MNLVARSLVTGALLLSSAHVVAGDAEADGAVHKVAAVKPATPSAGKKVRPAQGIKAKPVVQPDEKTRPAVQESQGGAVTDPSGAGEQAVQLGGVRG